MPKLLVDRLERGNRLLELAKLVLAPAARKTTQPIGAHTLSAKSLPQEVDHRLVERLSPAPLLALQSFTKTRRQIPDRQRFDDLPLSSCSQ